MHRAHEPLEVGGRARPVEPRVLALDARREGDARRGLRRRLHRAGAEPVDRLAEGRGPERGEALREGTGGVVGSDRRLAREQDVARVHLFAHRHDAHARTGVTRHDGVRDRRRPAVPRQQRRMNVDAAARRQVEDRSRQDAAVSRDHDEIGRQRAQRALERRVAHPLGLQDREATRDRERLHRWRLDDEPASARPIGLADHADHRIRADEEGFEDGASERRSPHEEDAPGRGRGGQRTDLRAPLLVGRSVPRFWRSSLR
jgi:hypothetical protein